MISGISSGTDFNYLISSSNSTTVNSSTLSYTQQQTIDEVLSNYDSSSLTQSDAQEIVSAFKDAGIEPSKELEESMASLGFDAFEVGSLAGIQGQNGSMPPPPPPQQSSQEEQDTVSSLIEELFSNEEDDEESNILSSVSDYTSRILNLNEQSKQDVMDIFEKYNSDDSELSSEDAATLIKTQLSDILGNSNNYNHAFLYA